MHGAFPLMKSKSLLNMDLNDTVHGILSLEPFHEVKSKRIKIQQDPGSIALIVPQSAAVRMLQTVLLDVASLIKSVLLILVFLMAISCSSGFL